MNSFLVLGTTLLALLGDPELLGTEGPDDLYLQIYQLIQQADALADNGQIEPARRNYADAKARLERLQKTRPDWNTRVVEFRLNYVTEKLAPAKTPQKQVDRESAPTTPAVAESAGAFGLLQEQMRRLIAEKELLQAKLKEALSAQPAAVDPRELARAEETITSLQKEVEILKLNLKKAETKPDKPIDPATLEQTQQALTTANQNLAKQREIAASLTLERDALQARLQAMAEGRDAKLLREENELLKAQVTPLKPKAETAVKAEKLNQHPKAVRPKAPSPQPGDSGAASEQTVSEARAKDPVPGREGDLKVRARALEKELAQARTAAQNNADLVSALQTALRRAHEEKDATADEKRPAGPQPVTAPAASPAAQSGLSEQVHQEIAALRALADAREGRATAHPPQEPAMVKTPPATVAGADFPGADKSPGKPDGAALLIREAQGAFAAQRYDEAEKKYSQALRLDEKNSALRAHLAAAQIQQNKLAEAEANLKGALARDSRDVFSLFWLGTVKLRLQKYDEALNALSQAAQLDPQNADTFQCLGEALAEKGLRGPAESALRRAIQLAPGNGEAHHSLAVVYATQRPAALELARRHYQKSLETGRPKDPSLEKILGANPTAPAGGIKSTVD